MIRPAILVLLMAPMVPITWSTLAPLPRAQAGGAAALLGHTMMVAGGTAWENGVKLWLTDVQLYDTRLDQWRDGPALPQALAYGPFAQTASAVEIFGGSDGTAASRTIWRMDSSLQQWTKAGETPAVHLLGRAARVGDKVFLFGGCADVADLTQCADTVWLRDGSAAWRPVAKLPGGSIALSAVAVSGRRVFLFGGCSMPQAGQLRNHAEAWSFDADSFAFRRLRDLPAANRGLTAAAVDGRVWLFGGYTESGFTAAVYAYDPASDTYTAAAPMPAAMTSAEFVVHGKRLWAAGGEDRMKGRSSRTLAAVIGGR